MKYTQPLFIQSIMTLKGLLESKPAKLHLFGSPAVGDLKRPFAAAPSMFGESIFLLSASGSRGSGGKAGECEGGEEGGGKGPNEVELASTSLLSFLPTSPRHRLCEPLHAFPLPLRLITPHASEPKPSH